MNIKALKQSFKELPPDQLAMKVDELMRDLLTLRLQAVTSPIKSFPSKKRGLKRAIACGLTMLHQKRAV